MNEVIATTTRPAKISDLKSGQRVIVLVQLSPSRACWVRGEVTNVEGDRYFSVRADDGSTQLVTRSTIVDRRLAVVTRVEA